MEEILEFDAVIRDAGNGGAYVEVPFDVEAHFGAKRVKVAASIDGIEYRGSLVRMGLPCHMLPILKEIRQKLGKGIGDTVHLQVARDTAPRIVETPPDVAEALASEPAAAQRWDGLSYSNRREYVAWLDDTRNPATRARRVAKMLERLRQEGTTP